VVDCLTPELVRLAAPDGLGRYLGKARANKLPMTVREILDTGDDNNVAIMVGFADGTRGACLIPADMVSVDNIRISAAALAVVWEMLSPPAVRDRAFSDDEVIDLEDLDG
jgi:hypothetical protein